MLATLSMGEIRAIVLVNCKAETAFEGANMVLKKVGILVEVDGLKSELSKSFSAISIRA